MKKDRDKKTALEQAKDQKKQKLKSPVSKTTLFEKLNNFFNKRRKLVFGIIFFLAAAFSILLFDVKVTIGGDDSSYIVRAYHFIHGGDYPQFQGALYPIVLSLLILVFGINLVVLKIFSMICMLVFFYLFYKTFRDTVPAIVLYPSLFILSTNSFQLIYASQTYSEAFFMMVQVIFFAVFFRHFIIENEDPVTIKKDYKRFLLLGFWLTMVALTKNIGLASMLAVLSFFVITWRWKHVLFTMISFGTFMGLIELIKRTFWQTTNLQIETQGTGLLYKDYYNPSKGHEDFYGFIQRFIDNSNFYFSRHLYNFLGLRHDFSVSSTLTILVYLLFALTFVLVFRRNKYLFFTGVYVLVMCGITFIIIQKMWDQWRLIIIYFPYILVFCLSGLYYLFQKKRLQRIQIVFLLLLPVLFFTAIRITLADVNTQKIVLKKNLAGDVLYGMPQSWINYVKISQWTAKNLPKDKLVACRKADISFIYTGGREFFPIYSVPSIAPDTFLREMKKDTQRVAIAVLATDIFQKKGLEGLYEQNRTYIKAFIAVDATNRDSAKGVYTYIVYSYPKMQSAVFNKMFADFHVPVKTDLPKLVADIKKTDPLMVYYPDNLLKILRDGHVGYVIVANIRFDNDPKKKGAIMATVHRFMYFLELKYPMLREIYKIGTDADKAQLIELHYEVVDKMFGPKT